MCEKYDARTSHKNSRNTRHVCQAKQKVTKSEFEKVVMKNSSQASALKLCPQVREYLVIRLNCNFKSRNGSRREHSSWPWTVSCPSRSTYPSSSYSPREQRDRLLMSRKKLQLQQLEEMLLQPVNETKQEKTEFKKFGGEWSHQTNYRQMFVQILCLK